MRIWFLILKEFLHFRKKLKKINAKDERMCSSKSPKWGADTLADITEIPTTQKKPTFFLFRSLWHVYWCQTRWFCRLFCMVQNSSIWHHCLRIFVWLSKNRTEYFRRWYWKLSERQSTSMSNAHYYRGLLSNPYPAAQVIS